MNSKQSESRIPVLSPSPLRRSGSLRLGGCPPIKEHRTDTNHRPLLNRHRSLQSLNTASSLNHSEDDTASVLSFSSVSGASVCSNMSQCDHAHFARNGTTYSGRSKRYVYHCSPHSAETDDYLTPTQRNNRTIRKLRNLLKEAQEELADRDREIQRLTKEVVELRLLKADSDGGVAGEADQGGGGGGGDAQPTATSPPPVTPRYGGSPTTLAPSLSDSGHFEDLNSSHNLQLYLAQMKTLETTMESLQRQHEDEIRELKERHNDKVDSLLQRITDVNDRYYALRPLYEDCKEKLHELEKLNEELKTRPCQNHATRITELEHLNETIAYDKKALMDEVNSFNRIKEELELSKATHDKLMEENLQLKAKQEELIRVLNNLKEGKNNGNTMNGDVLLDGCSQTERNHFCNGSSQTEGNHLSCGSSQTEVDHLCNGSSQTEVDHLCNGITEVTTALESQEQIEQVDIMKENVQLKKEIAMYTEKLKQVEELQKKEKDIYVQLYQKGIQAAKMIDSEDVQIDQDCSQNSLVPDLLQKLRIKQEELDNLKAMYRRLLESRKDQPKHDPEMTLQFLKSAFYYFLTDRENAPGHLAAIESILGFSDNEKTSIEKAFLWR